MSHIDKEKIMYSTIFEKKVRLKVIVKGSLIDRLPINSYGTAVEAFSSPAIRNLTGLQEYDLLL